MSQIGAPVDNTEVKASAEISGSRQATFLMDTLTKYRKSKKTGLALYELISTLKEQLPKFEEERTQKILAEINVSENEFKMLHNHWDRPKQYFK